MGREARCRCRWGDSEGDVKALLEDLSKPGKGGVETPNAPALKENVEDLLWKLARSARQRSRKLALSLPKGTPCNLI